MKAIVAVKRVVDHAVKVRINQSTHRINTKNIKMAINPFCEIAMEEAVQLKQKHHIDEIIAVSIGLKACQEQLRYCMALGADRVESKTPMDVDLSPLTVAKALQHIITLEKPDLVLMGKQSIDGDNCQTGAILAGILDWPEASCVSSLTYDSDTSITVEEETEYGSRTLQMSLPAVITTDLRLNTPRYPKLPDIVKAKKKPLQIISLDSIIKEMPSIEILKLEEPEVRKKGIMCKDVDDLLQQLRKQGTI